MKTKHIFRLLALPIASILSNTAAHAAVVDTTGTTITYTAPQNILDTQVIGNGTLNFDGSGLIGLDNSGGGNPVTLAMTGGNITVQAGVTLQNGGWQGGIWTNNLSSLDLASGATLDVWDGNPVRVDALTGAGNVSISIFTGFGPNWAGNRSLVLGVNGGGGTFTGNISGNSDTEGGSLGLTKEGAGTQILSGANTYNGVTTINAGTLQISGSGSLGNGNYAGNIVNTASLVVATSANQTFSGGISGTNGSLTKSGAGTLTLSGANTYSYSGATSVNGGTLRYVNRTPNSSGALSIASGATLEFNVSTVPDAGDGANEVLGTVGGTTVSGTGTFVKSGAGILALDGQGGNHAVTFNMTGGMIDIQGGTLRNGGWDGGIWTTNRASMNIASGARLDIWNGQSVTVDALTGAGLVDSSSNGGTQILTVGINNGTGTFSGIFQNTTGSLKLTKEGTGTQTFSGSNTFTGGTAVNGGRLVLVNNKTGSSNFITNSELEFNVTSGTQQLNGGTISGTGNLIKSGAGQLLLGANGSSQTVAMSSGSLIDVQGGLLRNEYGNSAWGGNLADLNVGSGAYLDLWDGNITVDAITGSGTINKAWAGTNTLTVGADNGSGTFSGTISNLASPGGGYSGIGGGTLNLVKQGSGTQTLSGVNIYTGDTTVAGGTLAVNGSSIKDTNNLIIDGGTVNLTGAETVNTLFFGGVQQIAGTYSATGAGGTIASANFTGSGTLVVTTGSVSPYTTWANSFLPGNNVSNPAGDNDNDGLTNQQEFAFGLSPISGSSVNPIVAQLNKTAGQFSYQRLAASGLTYKILTSTTLATGSWTQDVTASQVAGATDGNGNQTVVVTLTGAPLAASKLFVRVAAE